MRWLAVVLLLYVGRRWPQVVGTKKTGVAYKTHCGHESMRFELVKRDEIEAVYLEGLKGFPVKACEPVMTDHLYIFNLKFSDIYECLLTKVVHKPEGRTMYYHRVVVEFNNGRKKQKILTQCDLSMMPSGNSTYDSEVEELNLVKRQAEFPEFFAEDYDVQITSEVTGRAPEPHLEVEVRQDGVLIEDNLVVKPGTPLNMEIFLDRNSAAIYGLLVTGMEVTDTISQTEPILVNGCSVDPYLFENFDTDNGDNLRAKFRAFKFPESNVVLFKGTVNVCLDKCEGVQCSNRQIGFGRRKRREVSSVAPDPNKVYEISMSTLIKLECEDCLELGKEYQEVEGSVKVVSKKDFYESFGLSAHFEEFKAPGEAVFEDSSSNGSTLSGLTVLVATTVLALVSYLV